MRIKVFEYLPDDPLEIAGFICRKKINCVHDIKSHSKVPNLAIYVVKLCPIFFL